MSCGLALHLGPSYAAQLYRPPGCNNLSTGLAVICDKLELSSVSIKRRERNSAKWRWCVRPPTRQQHTSLTSRLNSAGNSEGSRCCPSELQPVFTVRNPKISRDLVVCFLEDKAF